MGKDKPKPANDRQDDRPILIRGGGDGPERVCQHGVSHPTSGAAHTCDGCC